LKYTPWMQILQQLFCYSSLAGEEEVIRPWNEWPELVSKVDYP
jgi:hypothetical protein